MVSIYDRFSTNNWNCRNNDIDTLFQIQGLSIDVETKVLNDLGEKVHRMGEMLVERPALGKVITNIQTERWSEEIPFAYYVLYICSYAYDMRKRRVLNDNEWSGCCNGLRNCFQLLFGR